jgi:AcrR family transcriptional regulator
MVAKRLAGGRREELLDGVMQIIAARGFSDVRMSEIAGELHCSVASLYKIAPSKDSLVLLAIARWGEMTLSGAEDASARCATASARAREYYLTGARGLHDLSSVFRKDVERFESTRMLWSTTVADPFVDRFVDLLNLAVQAQEVRPLNTRFLAEMLRQIASVVRDERVLRASGLTAETAMMEIDQLVWVGVRKS